MKYLSQLTKLLTATIIFVSCKKDDVKLPEIASLNVTNAVVGGTTVRNGSSATTIANNNYAQLGLIAGAIGSIYMWPAGDSAHPYYADNKFSAENRGVYSLFLGGTPTAVDAIFIKENIPYHTDSTAGIRFINLSPNTNGKPLNITLLSTPTVNEVSNLAYKQYTDFKTYPGLTNSAYTFQIRNDTCAAPKNPLATFVFTSSTVPRFANVTLVVRQSGNGVAVFMVKNDR